MKGTSCIVLANALSGLLVVGLFSYMPLRAPIADQAAQIVKNLSKPANTVVSRLTELNRLPADDWRYHVGDLAHDESADLDDSSWSIAKANTQIARKLCGFGA